ncbi:MAG: hypothetical protein IPJ32_04705 [Sphingobacteriaceae bacterium]|nr:hypothetical protein [Sphingobacteriaceae bacterium]
MKINLVLSILFISFSFFAQTEAVTKDGKDVILYKNGTWKYAKTKKVATPISGELKAEATEFSMLLVHSYFNRDCSVFQKSLVTDFLTFKEPLKLRDEHMTKICESVLRAVIDSSKTFMDYLNTYKMDLLSRAELEAKMKTKLPAHFNTTDAEFYFLGFELMQPGSTKTFIQNDLYALVLRKVEGKWQVKGILSD